LRLVNAPRPNRAELKRLGRPLAEPPLFVVNLFRRTEADYFPAAVSAAINSGTAVL